MKSLEKVKKIAVEFFDVSESLLEIKNVCADIFSVSYEGEVVYVSALDCLTRKAVNGGCNV
jgi:hypothetical protein